MASMDHTARTRALVCNEPESKPAPTADVPLLRSGDQERRRAYESQRANTALALAVIEGMLKTSSAFKQTLQNGKRSGFMPLNPVQLIGLETAIDLLHHYVDTLSPERTG